MIGCTIYTDSLECLQYVNDVMQIKVMFIALLFILSLLTLYFVNSKKFKKMSKKFTALYLMFILPKYSAYLFFATSFLIPFFMSINVERDVFLNYIYAFLVPNIVWILLILFMYMFEMISHKLGFDSTKHFMKSVSGKNDR